jgi:hypothetical protein
VLNESEHPLKWWPKASPVQTCVVPVGNFLDYSASVAVASCSLAHCWLLSAAAHEMLCLYILSFPVTEQKISTVKWLATACVVAHEGIVLRVVLLVPSTFVSTQITMVSASPILP